MHLLRALRLGRVGLHDMFDDFGVQRAPMRVWGGAVSAFRGRPCVCGEGRCSYFNRGGAHISVAAAGRSFAFHVGLVHLLWRGAGVQCYILAFFLLVAFGQFVRCRGGVVFVLCSRGPLGLARNTHRGARTHDHKVKGLALCRLS